MITLDTLKPGQAATVTQVGGTGALRHHLLDMGFTPRTGVELIKRAPMGDPIQIKLRGYEITLRLAEAQLLAIEDVRSATAAPVRPEAPHYSIPHPGRGELDRAPRPSPQYAHGYPEGGAAALCPCGQPELRQDDAF